MNKLKRRFRDFQNVRYLNLCRLHNRRLGGWSRFITLKNKWRLSRLRSIIERFNRPYKVKPRARLSMPSRLRSKYTPNLYSRFGKKLWVSIYSKAYLNKYNPKPRFPYLKWRSRFTKKQVLRILIKDLHKIKSDMKKGYYFTHKFSHWKELWQKSHKKLRVSSKIFNDNSIHVPKKHLDIVKKRKLILLTERELQMQLKKRPKKGEPLYRPPFTWKQRAEKFKTKSRILLKKNPQLRRKYIFDLLRFRTKSLLQKNKWGKLAFMPSYTFKKLVRSTYSQLNRKWRFASNKEKKRPKGKFWRADKKSGNYFDKWRETLVGTSNASVVTFFNNYPEFEYKLLNKKLKSRNPILSKIREWQKRYRIKIRLKKKPAFINTNLQPRLQSELTHLIKPKTCLKLGFLRKWKGWNDLLNPNIIEDRANSLRCTKAFSYASFVRCASILTIKLFHLLL